MRKHPDTVLTPARHATGESRWADLTASASLQAQIATHFPALNRLQGGTPESQEKAPEHLPAAVQHWTDTPSRSSAVLNLTTYGNLHRLLPSPVLSTIYVELLAQTRAQTIDLERAMLARDLQTTENRAHAIAGSARMVGAEKLADAAQAIQSIAAELAQPSAAPAPSLAGVDQTSAADQTTPRTGAHAAAAPGTGASRGVNETAGLHAACQRILTCCSELENALATAGVSL